MKARKLLAAFLCVLMATSVMVLPTQAAVTGDEATGAYTNSTEPYSTYSGSDLGANYTKAATTFKVWAPSASKVQIKRYTTGSDAEAGAAVIETKDMAKDSSNGVWSVKINGDLNGTYYTYLVTVNGKTNETQDVYSIATGVNGERSMVVDLSTTDPEGWNSDSHQLVKNQTDAVIWEVQVRDFSISSSSGVSDAHKGKYLAFTESGTKVNGTDDISTCVDYLVKQGVNYVHLNPVYDYGSVDETKLNKPQYNWGYDPVNYNVPEGSYSTDPYKGEVRIKEFKQMVQALHDRGIGVIMDVVYNHTYSTASSFEKTVPGYYYRMNGSTFLNGSGCGNVTASDKTMFRKYITDSVKYWAEEYHIDGFRFDLMGCHDVTTMNQVRTTLDAIDQRIIVYGEPWMADWNSNGIASSQACVMDNASKVSERVGMFSDKIRNALKGGTDDATKGYIQGSATEANAVKAGMMGGASSTWGKWSRQPSQCVTYNSAHDNLTLWDKILKSNSLANYDTTSESILSQNRLSAAIVLTSQGTPFYLAGEEFARTKRGDHNSYNAPDSVNQIDWTRIQRYSGLVEYYKGLMKIRANYSPFRDPTTASGNTTYFVENGSAIGYTMQNKTANASKEWGTVAVLTNNTTSAKSLTLKVQSGAALPSSWVIVANGTQAGTKSLGTTGSTVSVPARSAMVLVDAASFAKVTIPETSYKTVTVKHVNQKTGEVLKTITSDYEVGSTYRTQPDSDILFDYNLVKTEGVTSGTVTNNVTVTYYYTPDSVPSYTLTVKYVDGAGKDLMQAKTQKLKQGVSYSEQHETIAGYELDTAKFPNNAFGTISADTTVTYTYKATAYDKLKVHYYNGNGWANPYIYAYDDSTGLELLTGAWPGTKMTADSSMGAGWFTYPEVDVPQAKLMFTDGKASGTQQEPGQNAPGYDATGEVWVKDGGTSFNTKVVVSYINQSGKKLADDKVIEGKKVTTSDSYKTQGLSGTGEPVLIMGAPEGNWGVGTKNVVYVYNDGTEPPTNPDTKPTDPDTKPTDPDTKPTNPEEGYMLGDINGDWEISVADVLMMQNYLAAKIRLTDRQIFVGDVDRSGKIDLVDILEIQKYLAKMDSNFEIGKIFGDAPTDPTQTDPQPTDPKPTDPQPTDPVPTDPQPTNPQPTDPEGQTVTLYFSNSVFWGKVYAYAWRASDEHKNQEWPGEQLTSIGKNSYGEEIYSLTIDLSEYDNIIFSNGEGQQTQDIPLSEASDSLGYYCDKSSQDAQGHYAYGTYEFDPSFIV